ncbi:integral membrane protein 2A [Condylostylus longicornis]|uniref:integral membrane protein 2A n=1 Tax=Condylostylus longicornis TaxID=2530218 RepID=UPI00244E1015|nr:integral membrane protein 2A [Condylostylus longicornis]
MTILTKSTIEKKPEKVALPLVSEGNLVIPSAPLTAGSISEDSNVDTESMIFYRRRMSASTTIFLFLSAVAVMLMGILGGVTIYRLYSPSQNRMHFRGMCDIPYDSQSVNQAAYVNPEEVHDFLRSVDNIMNGLRSDLAEGSLPSYFREEYELDLSDDESYAKINVPDFQDGRSGRFMHDFKVNQSAIIDTSKFRCFVMPLDRETVLPPKNFYDLLQKMRQGYYNIDTERVRQNWRVVLPELNDTSSLSPKIAQECTGMKTYMLEKYVSGVFKRSAELHDSGKFAEFVGKYITEFNLININEVEDLENQGSN